MRQQYNLNGSWEFQIDSKDIGESNQWQRNGLPTSTKVEVPHIWQTDLEHVQYCGVAWYQRKFQIEQLDSQLRTHLYFGAVDFQARVWINDTYIGDHEGGFTPFSFDITNAIQWGVDNTITVRVYDPQDNAEIPIGKQGSWYTRISGIWQEVYIELRHEQYVQQVHVHPNIDVNEIQVQTSMNYNGVADISVEYVVYEHQDRSEIVATTTHAIEQENSKITIMIPQAKLWYPEEPNLYDLVVKILDNQTGAVIDEFETYFGMRKIDFKEGQLLLNNKPLFVRGALDQSYYPDTIYVAPSDEWMQNEIKLAKEMGFNLLRKHIKVEIPRYLYWADAMGILIWAEPPNTVKWSDQSKARFTNELNGMIARDMNHPSIIIWSLYNEEWGLEWDLSNDLDKQAYVQQMYYDVKCQDPTRLICDNSGWIHVKTDVNDYHRYFALPEQINEWKEDIHDYMAGHPEQNYVEGYMPDGQPIIISEFGVWGLPSVEKLKAHYGEEPFWFNNQGDDTHREDFKSPPNAFANFEKYQLDRVFGDMENLSIASQKRMYRAVKSLIEEMRKHPGINGYVVTEFTDVEWETNGWLDYTRNLKYGMDHAADFNGGLIVMADGLKHNLQVGQQQIIDVIISNHDQVNLNGVLHWEIPGTEIAGSIAIHEGNNTYVKLENVIMFTTPEVAKAGFYSLQLSFVSNGVVLAKNEEELTISPVQKLSNIKVHAYQLPTAFGQSLVEHGAILVEAMESAQIVLSASYDATIQTYYNNGGKVIFLAEQGDHIADKGQFTFRELVKGESWDRTSSFNYVDVDFFENVPLQQEMGWEVEGLYPDYIIPFSNYNKLGGTMGRIVYMFGNEHIPRSTQVISGYFQGWIGQAGGSMIAKKNGDANLFLTTWKLINTYGQQPIATQIVHELILKGIND